MHTHAGKVVLGPFRQKKSSSTAQAMTSRTSPIMVNMPAQRQSLGEPAIDQLQREPAALRYNISRAGSEISRGEVPHDG